MAILFGAECEFELLVKVESAFDVRSNGRWQRANVLVNICFHVFIKVRKFLVIFVSDLCSQPKCFVCV